MQRGQTEAETCHLNGWVVGTVLSGDEGFGPSQIRITAIGEEAILARQIKTGDGVAVDYGERSWSLSHREWRLASEQAHQHNEFQQVAALLALDVDVLAEIANDRTLTADELRAQIRLVHERKNEVISNATLRQSRYAHAVMLLSVER